jgi:pSer/pThr/pTyr-binding forkhead associated (FHA) protein
LPPFLVTQRGPEIGRRYELGRERFTVGRGHDNDLVLPDRLVSRYHAVICLEPNGVSIVDLGGINPVSVNNAPLNPGESHSLAHRDVVVIGENVFSFQDPERPEGARAVPPAGRDEVPTLRPAGSSPD